MHLEGSPRLPFSDTKFPKRLPTLSLVIFESFLFEKKKKLFVIFYKVFPYTEPELTLLIIFFHTVVFALSAGIIKEKPTSFSTCARVMHV
jgi:hypothetical protein